MVTYEELLQQLQSIIDIDKIPEGFKTIDEWAKEWNVTYARAQRALAAIKEADRLEHRRVRRERLDGMPKTVTVFSVKPETKRGKANGKTPKN